MKTLKALLQKNMLVSLLMGFSSGMPFLLTSKTLQGWLTDEAVDIKTIGLFLMVGLPYTLKFLWSPIFDRYEIPKLGRRRGWILITQLALTVTLAVLAVLQPKDNLTIVAAFCLLISFFGASQDIVIDAYRRESFKDNELGIGSTFYIYGYRFAMWITGGLAFILADQMSWNMVYMIMAGFMGISIAFTLFADEPKVAAEPPRSLAEAVYLPLKEFFSRKEAWLLLIFILLYKMGDTLAGALLTPFYLKLGFSKTEVGAIVKTMALFTTLGGGLIGGLMILRYGIMRCLMWFGILQALSTAGFALLASHAAMIGTTPSWLPLAVVIAIEDVTAGMGTAAFAAFMASKTNKAFTATQYALMTSLMGVPRVIFSSGMGAVAEKMGVVESATFSQQAIAWQNYFILCTLIAIPGLLLLLKMGAKGRTAPSSKVHAAT